MVSGQDNAAGKTKGPVAGRQRRAMRAATARFASLREDYLNQVQRDFLSRGLGRNTPSGCALASTRNCRRKKALRRGLVLIGVSAQSKTGLSTPSTLCSLGLVVVYCRNTFFSGKMMGMAPKAASAHSWKPERMSFFLPG